MPAKRPLPGMYKWAESIATGERDLSRHVQYIKIPGDGAGYSQTTTLERLLNLEIHPYTESAAVAIIGITPVFDSLVIILV